MSEENKPTLVLGASPNTSRYSNIAVRSLLEHGHKVYAVGRREGKIEGVEIDTGLPIPEDVHTVAIYLGKENQQEYYNYIMKLDPERIIFPPGAENDELGLIARANGIETMDACTMVMLSIGNY